MSESFVDLTYRGLALGRRVKLAQVRPSTGYLEMPAPMPVGSRIAVATDDGVTFEALVRGVHEQTGGSTEPPGMLVAPALADDAVKSWWSARVTLPELEPPRERRKTEKQPKLAKPADPPAPLPPTVTKPMAVVTAPVEADAPPTIPMDPVSDQDVMAAAAALSAIPERELAPSRSRPVTLRPRRQTQADDAPTQASAPLEVAAEPSVPELVDDGKQTQVMDSVDPALIEQLLGGRPSQPGIATDEGPRTTAMDAVDLAALGLDAGKSGSMAAVTPVDDEPSDATDSPDESKPTKAGSSGSVRRRRNPKKR